VLATAIRIAFPGALATLTAPSRLRTISAGSAPSAAGAEWGEGVRSSTGWARSRRRSAKITGYTWGYTQSMAKVMVSLQDDLLAAIDAEAARRNTSRSGLLATAARHELARRDSTQMEAAIARSEERFRSAGSFEAAELVRNDRDTRR
jgi:hypothetical protein